MQEILTQNFSSIRKVYEFLKKRGMKTNKPEFRIRKRKRKFT